MRVLIVDDNALIRAGIVTLLKKHGAFELIAEAADGLSAVDKARELQCDLVLMDISLNGVNGFSATRLIRDLLPQCRVLYVTNHVSAGMLAEAMNTGACGYIAKTDIVPDLITGIAAVHRREYFVSRSCVGLLPELGSRKCVLSDPPRP